MIKVAVAHYKLSCGGADRWAVDLVNNLDKFQVDYQGLFIADTKDNYAPFIEESQKAGPVLSLEENIDKLNSCDIVLYWGNPDLFRNIKTQKVCTLHGSADWVQVCSKKAEEHGDLRAVVSKRITKIFPTSENIPVIRNGVDVDRCIAKIPAQKIYEDLGLDPSQLIIGYIGRIAREKGPLRVAETARYLGNKTVPVFIGPVISKQLEKDIREIAPNAIILPPQRNIGDFLQIFDCYILSSFAEGNALGLLEAFAAGVPVVATYVGALPELTDEYGELCVSVPPYSDARSFAGAVLQAISPDNYHRIATAQNIVNTFYTAKQMGYNWSRYCCKAVEGNTAWQPDYSLPGVSIVTPVFNTPPRYLNELWDSIQAQTYKKWEWVIVDDGSTNTETVQTLRKLAHDPRVNLLLCEEHRNVAVARNEAIKLSRYSHIAIVDSDDVMLPCRLAVQISYMQNHLEVDICGTSMITFDDLFYDSQKVLKLPVLVTKQLYKRDPEKYLWCVNNGTAMFKKERILQIGDYWEKNYKGGDNCLWLNALRHNYVIHNLPYVTTLYRQYYRQLSKQPQREEEVAEYVRLKQLLLES